MRIFIYTELSADLKSMAARALPGHDVVFRNENTSPSSTEFSTAELLLGNPPKDWIPAAKHLRFWQLDSAGFDQYRDVHVAAVVSNMGDFFAVKCAETMVAGILSFYRNIHKLIRLQEARKWVGKPLRYEMDLLTEKRVIIFGAGTIARSIRKMLNGFDCDVVLAARNNAEASIRSREELTRRLPDAALVINTLPGVAHRYADKSVFDAMKEGSLYAAVGRGNTTDESALIDALRAGKLSGAVLDVTENEPLPQDSPLWEMENVILTQHTAGGYKFEDESKINLFVSNVKKFVNRETVANVIDLGEGY